jgi:uncharacterized protein involved in exopolysaccharide biosynthesis
MTMSDYKSPQSGTNDDGPQTPVLVLNALTILLRHRWIILAATALVPLVALGVLSQLPRHWTVSTSFSPEAGREGTRSQFAGLAGQLGINIPSEVGHSPEFYASVIRSRVILESLAEATYSVPVGGVGGAIVSREATIADVLKVKGATPLERRENVIVWLRSNAVGTWIDRHAGMVWLSVRSESPHLSLGIANSILDHLNAFDVELRQTSARAERAFTASRVDSARAELRSVEDQLVRFLVNNRSYHNSPELVFEHDRLQRYVIMRQQIFTSVAHSSEEARLREVRNTPVITVVEPPYLPHRPDSRRLTLWLPIASAVGMFMGIVAAVLLDYFRVQSGRSPFHLATADMPWPRNKA